MCLHPKVDLIVYLKPIYVCTKTISIFILVHYPCNSVVIEYFEEWVGEKKGINGDDLPQ